jgi:Glutathione S-transferase, N-terminal domain
MRHRRISRELMMWELYHNNISVCAQKVRIVLAEKDVPWTNHHLSLARGEHLTPEFKALNPRELFRYSCMTGTQSSNRA